MENKKTILDKFLDFGKGWGLIITLVGGLVAIGIKMETRIFSSPDIKYETEKLVVQGPTAEQKHRDRILDSINKTKAIKSRALRDSVFILIRRDQVKSIIKQKIQDSINVLNADQLYQIKNQLKNN